MARAETAGGWGGGFAFRRGESMYFRRSGGWATGAILAPCGRFRLFRLMPPPNDITINWRPRWRGRKRPGKGAVARFPRGKSTIFVGGRGGGIAFMFRPGGRNRTLCPVSSMDNMTIKRRMTGFGLKRPGDGVAASLLEGGNQCILGVLGGGHQGPFWHHADDLDCSA